MQLEREKSKKKKNKQEFQVIDQSRIVVEQEREQNEQLGSWEDLREQTALLENMYPSAPIPESEIAAEIDFHLVKVEYPPLLVMDTTKILDTTAATDVSSAKIKDDLDLLLKPSAPLFELVLEPSAPSTLNTINVPSAPAIGINFRELDTWAPLNETILDQIYINPLETEQHGRVLAFRASNLPNSTDPFYHKLYEYEDSFTELLQARKRITIAFQRANDTSSKFWTMKRDPVTLREFCSEGWSLSHTYVDEIATINPDLEHILKNCFYELKRDVYVEYPRSSFSYKLSKYWIQSHIDECLSESFVHDVNAAQKANIQGINLETHNETLSNLSHLLDILFVFERRNRGFENEKMQLLKNDIHTWIRNLASCIYWAGNSYLVTRNLLHALRTPEIGNWGANLIYYAVPPLFSESFLDEYLVCLQALFAPIEEMEEILAPKRVEEAQNRKEMLKSESEQWIVIEGDLFKEESSTVPKSISLTEKDYKALIQQFNIVNIFRFCIHYYFSPGAQSPGSFSSVTIGNLVMKGISIANRIFHTLARVFFNFPASFTNIRPLVASTIVTLNQVLIEVISGYFKQTTLTQQLFFTLPGETIKHTTLQNEIDSFLYRTIKILWSKRAAGVAEYSTNLPLAKLSHSASVKVVQEILDGRIFHPGKDQSNIKLDGDYLIEAILRNENIDFIFHSLSAIFDAGPEIGSAVGSRVIQSCFRICLANADLQNTLLVHVSEILGKLCYRTPSLVGFVLQRVSENFKVMENVALKVFQRIPLDYWIPEHVDIFLIANMLKDPIGSKKSLFACRVIELIDWDASGIQGECRKSLGLALVNIHLDRMGRSKGGLIMGASNAVANTASRILARAATDSEHLIPDTDELFVAWSWFNLYHQPSSYNEYVASPSTPIIESWESPELSTIKGFVESDAMAAYLILMISEIGHRFDVFRENNGWRIFTVLAECQNPSLFLRAAYEVFRNFHKQMPDILSTADYIKLATCFWKEKSGAKQPSSILKFLEQTTLMPLENDGFPIKFWCSLGFSDQNWPTSRPHLELLNELCKHLYCTPRAPALLEVFGKQYRSLIFGRNQTQKPYLSKLTGFFDNSEAFPTMVVKNFPGYLTKGGYYANQLFYFLAIAISTEVFAEKELRSNVSSQLRRGVKIEAVKSEKPIIQFSVYQTVELLLEFPVDHPMTPIMWQTFFSLFLERDVDEDSVCVGHRYFSGKTANMFSLLEKRLGLFQSQPGSVSWKHVLDAFGKWLTDPTILLLNVNLDSYAKEYCPEMLKSCANGTLFSKGSAVWWISIIPPLVTASKPPHTQRLQQANYTWNPPVMGLLDSPILPAPLSPFAPLIPSLRKVEDFNFIFKTIKKEIEILKSQGMRHSDAIQEHNKLDIEYLGLLAKLYSTGTSSSIVTKRCGSQCDGIIFQFEAKKSYRVEDISSMMNENRKKCETLIRSDHVDSLTAISGLRISCCLERIFHSDMAQIIVKKDVIELFYSCLDLHEIKLQAYPPADYILSLILKQIGMAYITCDEEQTLRVFEILKKGKHIQTLTPFFLPGCSNEKFPVMLKELSSLLCGDDALLVLSCFRFRDWCNLSNPPEQRLINLLDIVLTGITLKAFDQTALAAHFILFKDLLEISKPLLLKNSITKILDQILGMKIPLPQLLSEWLGVLGIESFEKVKWQAWGVSVVVGVDYQTVYEIIQSIQGCFAILLSRNSVKFVHAIKFYLSSILQLLGAIFSCSVIFKKELEFRLHEILNQQILIFLSIFQIPHLETQPVKIHELYEEEELDSIFAAFVALNEKACKQFNRPILCSEFLWKLYSRLVPTQSFLLLKSFHEHSSPLKSKDFLFNLLVFSTTENWIERKLLSVSSARFLANLLLCSTVDLGKPVESIFEPFRVFFYCFVHLQDLEVDRRIFFDTISELCLQDPRIPLLSAKEFSDALALMPLKWQSNLVSISISGEIYALPACLVFLVKIIKISAVDKDVKLNLVSDYFCKLLGLQVNPSFLQDALAIKSHTFAPDSIGVIAMEFLGIFESELGVGVVSKAVKVILSTMSTAEKGKEPLQYLNAGFLDAIDKTMAPLEYLDEICKSALSSEQMALGCEACMANCIAKAPLSLTWQSILKVMQFPELDESGFIRNCLSNALVFTLYSHAHSRLQRISNVADRKSFIYGLGEQIGSWIEAIQLDSLMEGKEPFKIILLILLFSQVLNFELSDAASSDRSRMQSYLKPLQDTMFKWSNPPSLSLWSALGFRKETSMPPELRLFCRFAASYIASRLMTPGNDVFRKTQLKESLFGFIDLPDYSSLRNAEKLKQHYLNEKLTMIDLFDLLMGLSKDIFPNIAHLYVSISFENFT